jgi:acyl carrier protein
MSVQEAEFEAIRTIVARVAGPGRIPESVSRETRLGKGYLLDSVEMLDVVIACETEFDIAFGEQDLKPSSFETLGSLTDLVRSKVAGKRV